MQEQGTLVTPDFSEVADTVGEGVYKTRVADHKMDSRTDKNTQRNIPVIVWTLETFGEDEPKNNGRKIFLRTDVVGKGAFRLKNFYKAVMGEDLTGSFDPAMLRGREIEVTYGPQKNDPQYMEIKAMKQVSAQH